MSRWFSVVGAVALAACGGQTGAVCGPGTQMVGNQCLPVASTGGTGGLVTGGSDSGGSGNYGAGGSGNLGGSGSGGDACSGLTVTAAGTSPLIDDMEDGDATVLPTESRTGGWWLTGDAGCVTTPQKDALVWPVPVAGTGNTSAYALHVAATQCNVWGFGVGVVLNPHEPIRCGYDASVYEGVYFWAKADSASKRVNFSVATRQNIPVSFGGGDGTCDEGAGTCWDAFNIWMELTDTWQLYAVRWADLAQTGWGAPATFDPTQLIQMGWNGPSGVVTDFWIDQTGFISGDVPTTPPGAGGAGGASGAAGAGG